MVERYLMRAFTSSLFIIGTWLVVSYSQDALVLPLLAEIKFHCITPDSTYTYTWKVNETVVTSNSTFPNVVALTSPSHTSNGSTQGSLTFVAHAQANNTNIKCFLTNRTYIITPLDYNIIIQGYPSPPDVVYVMEHHSVRFSWSTPFSLNITDSEPDILYYVITIITADENTTMNTTDTVYLLQPELCLFSEYRVEIGAVNIVGMGEKYTSPPLSLEELSLSGTDVIFGNRFPVVNIQVSTTCPEDIHYAVELIPTFSTKRIVISNLSSVGQTSLTLSSPDIHINEYYEAIVRVEGSIFLELVNISTFDVQSVDIKLQNDVKEYTDITCHFALGSDIKGCRIVISINLDGEKSIDELDIEHCAREYTAISEEGSSEGTVSVRLPKGEYLVLVYDDEDVEVENPSYKSAITISSSLAIKPSGCVSMDDSDLSTMVDEVDKNGTVNVAVTVAVLVTACIVIFLTLALSINVYVYRHRYRGRKTSPATENDYIDTASFQRPPARAAQPSQSSDSTDSGDSPQPSTESSTPLVPARPNYVQVQVVDRFEVSCLFPLPPEDQVMYATLQMPDSKLPISNPQMQEEIQNPGFSAQDDGTV